MEDAGIPACAKSSAGMVSELEIQFVRSNL